MPLYYFSVEQDRPERATHLIGTGVFRRGKFDVTVSGYRKWYRGLLKSAGPGPRFVQTPGTSWGIELETKGHCKRIDPSLAYTLSRSHRTDQGLTYDTNFDQRHRLQFFGDWGIGREWVFSWFWEFHTGQPYHPGIYRALVPMSDYGMVDWILQETSVRRGAIRYPPYHRLDIQLEKNRA